MIVTTLAALAWQSWAFLRAVINDRPLVQPNTPIAQEGWQWLALTFNGIFVLVGVLLFVLGLRMALSTLRGYREGAMAAGGEAPAPAGGGGGGGGG
jgi:hypothetical protein